MRVPPASAIVSPMRLYHSSRLRKGRNSEERRIYLITPICDGRKRVFSDSIAAQILVAPIRAQALEDRCENCCYVVMPDHLHWLLQLAEGASLSDVVGRAKGRSSLQINRSLGGIGRIWQAGFHDHAVRVEEDLENLAYYTILNPVRAGLVSRAEDYPHWWSRWHPRVRV